MQRGRQVRNIQTLPILAIEVDCKRKKSDPRRCARHNGRVRENPGRQQACWGFLIRCTNLTQPTGALDYNTSKEILQLIEKVNKQYGNTIIIVTHNDAIKNMADKVVHLHDGRIRKEYDNENKIPAEQLEW